MPDFPYGGFQMKYAILQNRVLRLTGEIIAHPQAEGNYRKKSLTPYPSTYTNRTRHRK